MNVFIVGSPWHAVVACALVESKGISAPIFVVEKISEKSLEQILTVLSGREIFAVFSHEETRFISIKNIGVLKFISRMQRGFSNISRSAAFLKERMDSKGDEVTNIYYFNFYSPITRRFLREFRNAQNVELSRVEDGVCDYFPFNFMNYSLLQRVGKMMLALVLGKYSLYSRSCGWLFNRTSGYYLFFSEKADPKWSSKKLLDLKKIAPEIRRVCLSEIDKERCAIDEAASSVLMLGQTLYEDGICSLEDELSIYQKAGQALGRKIYFKPHPRSCPEKIKALHENKFFFIDMACSAEALLSAFKFYRVLGLWSNTIIYSRIIFDLPSYSLGYYLSEKVHSQSLFRIHSFLSNNFTDEYVDFRRKNSQ